MAYLDQLPIEPVLAVNDSEALQFWADEFGVELEELVRATALVGNQAGSLQEYFTGIPALVH